LLGWAGLVAGWQRAGGRGGAGDRLWGSQAGPGAEGAEKAGWCATAPAAHP
jgi:hypothetical protein